MPTILICFIFSFNAKILAAQYDIGKIGIIWAENINKLNHIDIIEAVFSTENVNKFYLSGDFHHKCYKYLITITPRKFIFNEKTVDNLYVLCYT